MSNAVGTAYYIEGTPDWDSLQVNVRIEPDEMGRLDFVRVSNRMQGHERDIVFVPKTRLEAYERAFAEIKAKLDERERKKGKHDATGEVLNHGHCQALYMVLQMAREAGWEG